MIDSEQKFSNQKYPNLPSDFPEKIREHRLAKGLSQKQVADAIGIGHVFLSQVERRERNLSYERAVQLKDFLEIDVDLPLPDRRLAKKITRDRPKKGDVERPKGLFVTIDDEVYEIVTYRKVGTVIANL